MRLLNREKFRRRTSRAEAIREDEETRRKEGMNVYSIAGVAGNHRHSGPVTQEPGSAEKVAWAEIAHRRRELHLSGLSPKLSLMLPDTPKR